MMKTHPIKIVPIAPPAEPASAAHGSSPDAPSAHTGSMNEPASETAQAAPTKDPETPETAAAPVTAGEIEQFKNRAAKADEFYDQLLRKAADLDNFKKRVTREKLEAAKFANEALLQKLVPVLDNFDMALAAADNADSTAAQSLRTGVHMIYQQLKSALAEAGLEEIDATGKPFDPNQHEAISQKETAEVSEGQVVQQLRKGYKLRDRLLRPASVVVAKRPPA